MRVGIDLGTTFSLISTLQKDGQPVLLPDNSFKDVFSTPSAVYISERNASVGYLVDTILEQNPDLPVIRFFKRNFGENSPIHFDKQGNGWLAETIGALVLKKLKFDAEGYTGNLVESAVITVPAHFNDLQRKAVLNAAALAEIPVLGLVEEPVAAALHYGVTYGGHNRIFLVYDLGGGTFDVSILSMDEKGVYVLAKDGNTELGGKEFDEAISGIILQQFEKNAGYPLPINALTSLQLRRISEEIKIELSIPNKPFLKKHILIGQHPFEIMIYRKDFEQSIRSMIEKTIEITVRCIDGAGLKLEDIDALLLVGGSSMVPYVRDRLCKVFPNGDKKISFHEPMRAVAYGASLHAAQLSGEAEAMQIPSEFRGVTGYNVGIKIFNPQTNRTEIDCLIKKNLPLPSRAKRTYYTSSAQQTKIMLQLVQYLDDGSSSVDIGELVIGPIPNPRINYAVDITVTNGEDGLIKIDAFDPNTGVELNKTFGKDNQDSSAKLGAQRLLVRNTFINNLF
jgi:molecular chaperone DnaK (HSP70)